MGRTSWWYWLLAVAMAVGAASCGNFTPEGQFGEEDTGGGDTGTEPDDSADDSG